jgi:receptor-type tyrosine-protein phosphatase O
MVTTDGKGFNGPNYFNGNYILGANNEVEFIATQGPIPDSFNDFWNIIILNKVHTMVGKVLK